MIIKILVIAFSIWFVIALAFMCWMLCMVQKINKEEHKNSNKIRKDDKKDETAA